MCLQFREVVLRALVISTALTFWSLLALPAQGGTVCTLLADAHTGTVLVEEGDCDSRVTPSSTFKVPLAAMAFDAGILTDEAHPVMAYRAGDPDWGGPNWTKDTDPADWLRYSVLWYSQRITHLMGAEALTRYAQDFGYENADFSGDPGFGNGLERAWVASSLRISPREQVAFMRALAMDALPISSQALRNTRAIVDRRHIGEWIIYGKTGAAYPRRADRSFDYSRGWGWFVGWAQSGAKTLVFARLTQASERTDGFPGILTRDALLREWPDLVH